MIFNFLLHITDYPTIKIIQHESTDADSGSVNIDACKTANDSIISKSSIENKDETINEACSTSAELLDPNKDVDIKTEPKRSTRKRKVKTVDAYEQKSAEKKNSKTVGSVKRQRKSKCDSDTKVDLISSVEIKPKRTRTTKPKANPIKNDQASSSLLNVDDVTGKYSTQNNIKTVFYCWTINFTLSLQIL